MEDIQIIEIDDNEEINVIELDDNEDLFPIALKTLLKGTPAETHMTYIDLSTDMTNPTELTDFSNKSGIYVAKNTGILCIEGEPITFLSEGQFFRVINYKDLGKILGEEIPEEDNIIFITIQSLEGTDYIFTKQGKDNWQLDVQINSSNINDYVDIDTSKFILKSNISSTYGLQFTGSYLETVSATNSEILSGSNKYKVITPSNIKYAIENLGKTYFPTKDEFNSLLETVESLKTELSTLKVEIEEILDTVVTV